MKDGTGDVPPVPRDLAEDDEWATARSSGLVSRRFKDSVDAYVTLRAAGMSAEKAYLTSGLPLTKDGKPRSGIQKMLAARKDINSRIARAAVRNVNMVDLSEDSLRTVHRFVSGEPILVTCKGCGKEQVLEIPLDLALKGAVEGLKVASRTDILTLRERAQLEQNPETRADMARKVLSELGGSRLPALDVDAEVTAEPESVEPSD